MRATAVIGANFGDEGKGHVVDFLADDQTIVVRFSGGANAGHTVQADGVRQIFHHIGSGSLRGAATFLSEHFIVNPFLWLKEQFPPVAIFIHYDAPLTTPYDMLVNQELERHRGDGKHGSCGVGINETVTRCETSYATRVSAFGNIPRLRAHLRESRAYARQRLDFEPSPEFTERLNSDNILESYLLACERMRDWVGIVPDYDRLRTAKRVIFEGSQGLLLDEHSPFFPHVTRARTGTTNAREIAAKIGAELDVVYVTRTYMTRHGAGPFPTEDKTLSFPDPTNVTNEWQGSLRFGTLDRMWRRIQEDSSGLRRSIAVTCMDQHPMPLEEIEERAGCLASLISYGPDRSQIERGDRRPIDFGGPMA